MSEVTRHLYHKWYTKKQKPQIDSWFQNVLNILGQKNIVFIVNKVTTGYCRGYYVPTTHFMPQTEATNRQLISKCIAHLGSR